MTPIHQAPTPEAPEIEQAVLGAMLLNAECIPEVADLLRPEAFHVEANARIFAAIMDLYRHRDPVDILTVTNRMKAKGWMTGAASPYYIAQLTNTVGGSNHLHHHALIIIEKHIRREQIRIGSALMHRAGSELSDPFDSMAEAMAEIRTLNEFGSSEARTMAEIVPETMDMSAPDNAVRFGFEAIDSNIRLEPGAVTIIGARPGMGKTSFLLSSAWRQAQMGHRPYIVQLEMKDRNLANRLVCGELGIPLWKSKRKKLSAAEIERMANWHITHGDAQLRLMVDESAGMTTTSLAARLDRARRKSGIDVVWIDHLGLLSPSTKQRPGYDRVTAISGELRVLAKEMDIPFAVLSQLSRPLKGSAPKPPSLTDLRDSGAIEQDAEAVCFLHRPRYYDPNEDDRVMFIRAKNRDGNDGVDELWFDSAAVRMVDRTSGANMTPLPQFQHAPF